MADKSARPIMRLLDILGRRWALRVLWELRVHALTSRQLRAACGDISPSMVQVRVDELRLAGLVSRQDGGGYVLTGLGTELLKNFLPLYQFAEHWASEIDAPLQVG